MNLGQISLVDGTARAVIVAVFALTGVWAVGGLLRTSTRKRTIIALAVGLGLPLATWLLFTYVWKPFPDKIALAIFGAIAAMLFVVFAAIIQKGRSRALRVLTALLSILAVASVVNLEFQQFPTVRSLNPSPPAIQMTQQEFEQATEAPERNGNTVGAIVPIYLSGDESHFSSRQAVAYVPPAYFTKKDVRLPVIVLLAGNPGMPTQWFGAGDAPTALDDFQAAHDGMSPIVISVDGTGSFSGNPICVDGPNEKVHTYLTVDVPREIKKTFRVNEDQKTWSIGGLSYGGTCSLQVVTNSPDSYGTFLDYSGQPEPTLGDHKQTVDTFFGGDEQAFQDANPATLLDRAIENKDPKYQHIQGRFVAGESDAESMKALKELNEKANKAGMKTEFLAVKGGHSFETWRQAFSETLEFAAARGGIK